MTNYGFFGHTAHLTDAADTIGHRFAAAGYHTAYLGKSHLGYPLSGLGYQTYEDHGGVPGGLAAIDRRIADDACAFIARRDESRPFFLTVSFHEPHPPVELVDGYVERYSDAELRPPVSYNDPLEGKPAFQLACRDSDEARMTDERFGPEVLRYLTMISHVDALYGQLRHALERSDIWDDTLVVFTSDHGDLMGAHGMRLKGTLPYDELLRVPLIIRDPRSRHRPIVDDLVSNVALPATLLDLAGITRDTEWTHRPALTDVLDTPTPEPMQHIFAEHYAAYWGLHPLRLVRTRHWKYVQYYGADDCEELYDLANDPHELRNVAGDTSHAHTKANLAGLLSAWWASTGGREAEYYESDAFRKHRPRRSSRRQREVCDDLTALQANRFGP